MTGLLVLLMTASVWKRRPYWVLVAFSLSFFAGFLEVVYYAGFQPTKLDFRPLHPAAIAGALGWTSAACSLFAATATVRQEPLRTS